MPVSTDDVGQSVQRFLTTFFTRMLPGLIRDMQRAEMMKTMLFEEAITASKKDSPYVVSACKSEKDSIRAASAIKRECERAGLADVEVLRRDKFIAYPRSVQRIAHDALKSEKIREMVLKDDINPHSKAPDFDWDTVALLDPDKGTPIDEEMASQIERIIGDAGIPVTRTGNVLSFHSSDRDRLIDVCALYCLADDARATGDIRDALFDEVADATVAESLKPATERQLKLINDLHDEGRISDREMAEFSLSGSFRAAHDLITGKIGREGWVDHGAGATRAIGADAAHSPSDTVAGVTRVIGGDGAPAGPDIARDAQAAMRREDIGNVETTADYVQARPNAGDHDRSTPYPDQCDPAGAGDVNGDGIRDAAQDRDGDGRPDPDDPEGIGEDPRTAQALCEEKTAEADYVDRLPKTRSADVSLQQETR